jgi:hypothetical protein
MCRCDCGEIPVIDPAERPIGVSPTATSCVEPWPRKNPMAYPGFHLHVQPVVTVLKAHLSDTCRRDGEHQVRRAGGDEGDAASA